MNVASILRRRQSMFANFSISMCRPTKPNCVFIHHLAGNDPSHTIVNSLCESLRKGLNWDTLSRKYDSMNLNDPIINRVLLELKEPHEAKRALSFFHWVAHSKKIERGLEPYCIIIHILARAHLVNDALVLLESVLSRNSGDGVDDSLRLSIVDMLLSTYRITNACPLVFDLLVQTYSKLSLFETAFDVCCLLDGHGFSLNLATFNTLIHKILKSADKSGLIWKVYGHMIQKRIYPNEVTVRTMISALCMAGELQKSVDIINTIHGRGCSPMVIVNASLVLRMIAEGRIEEVLVLLKRMLQKNLILDTVSYSLIVYAKLKSQELDFAREFYGEMLNRGFQPNPFVYTMFIEAYCEEGKVEEALDLMEEAVSMGLKLYDDTYNCLITGSSKAGNLASSTRLCEEMIQKGFLPSSSAFNEMAGKLCQSGNMQQANEILTLLTQRGFLPDETTFNYLIDGYRREGNMSEVLKLYYEMEFRSLCPGLQIFTSLIATLCEHGKVEEAEKYLAIMKCRSLEPTPTIYEQMICAYLVSLLRNFTARVTNTFLSFSVCVIFFQAAAAREGLVDIFWYTKPGLVVKKILTAPPPA
ncbi:hypothetical protein Cgig2_004280 [Carnegiea gigantea]|uniref:Pentatricopeptide repeat-containing protein n=1 Tax=Carnegiea gigantea TaxID=171969 RepID=A0A9Q1KGF1_9CARY|nr:hypothetical protein Cgig2_004280 [Carnegiea gigantea]